MNRNLSPKDVSIYQKEKDILHLARAYMTRNTEAHQCKKWSNSELFDNINSTMMVYLNITLKYHTILQEAVHRDKVHKLLRNSGYGAYVQSLVANFKQKISRFIHLSGEEDIRISQGFVVETLEDEEDQPAAARKGTVAELREREIPERRMMLWGDAGTGKTTTLEYLAYIDAEKHMKHPEEPIPVLISMGLLTDESTTIMNSICNKLGINRNTFIALLNDGRVNIFFDGINEIPQNTNNTLRSLRLREIQDLIAMYPKSFMIFSNRPQDGREFSGVPVFQVLRMSDEQVHLFMERNIADERTKRIIAKALSHDDRLFHIVKTPLMLSRLIEIVKMTGDIPTSEGKIIGEFLKCLLLREKNEKRDAKLDIRKVEYLLRSLAYRSLDEKGGNVGVTEQYLLDCFLHAIRTYRFEADTMYVIQLCLDLGILDYEDGLYQFSHQSYQDYYYAQEEMAVLGL